MARGIPPGIPPGDPPGVHLSVPQGTNQALNKNHQTLTQGPTRRHPGGSLGGAPESYPRAPLGNKIAVVFPRVMRLCDFPNMVALVEGSKPNKSLGGKLLTAL